MAPGLAATTGEVRRSELRCNEIRRGLASQLAPALLLCGRRSLARLAPAPLPAIRMRLAEHYGTSSRVHQKARAVRDSVESGACAVCGSVRGWRQPRRARNPGLDRRLDPRPQ